MIEVAFKLSKNHDADLCLLYRKIGKKAFTKIARYSILSMKDSSYVDKIQSLYFSSLNSTYNQEEPFYLIRLSFSGENEEFISSFLPKIQNRKISSFIKYLIRSYIGLDNMIHYFLNEDIKIEKQNIVKLEIEGISAKPKEPKRRNRTTRPRVISQRPSVIKEEIKEKETISSSPEPINTSKDFELSFDEPETNDSSTMSDDDVLSMLNNLLS